MQSWNFQQGYTVDNESNHESNEEYKQFLTFLQAKKRSIPENLEEVAEKYNWRHRAADCDQHKALTVINQNSLLDRANHKQELVRFLEEQTRQAARTHAIAERINHVVENRLERAILTGEEIDLALIPAFMRASTVVSEESRKSWAASLGVTKMVEYIDTSIADEDVIEARVEEVGADGVDTEGDSELDYTAIEIPLEE